MRCCTNKAEFVDEQKEEEKKTGVHRVSESKSKLHVQLIEL